MSSLYKGLSVPDYTDSADAPLGFKQFVDSGPLPRFANATARNNAIAAPVKGMACYRLDTGVVELYNGSSWLSVNPLVPPAHTHPGGDIHNETILGGKIADNTIPVSGSNDKLTGVVANGHLPNASEDGQGIVELTAAVTSTSKVLALSARAATSSCRKRVAPCRRPHRPRRAPSAGRNPGRSRPPHREWWGRNLLRHDQRSRVQGRTRQFPSVRQCSGVSPRQGQ